MTLIDLDRLRDAGLLADIDRHFARLLAEFGATPDVALVAAIASARHRVGHTCVQLADCAGQPIIRIADWLAGTGTPMGDEATRQVADIQLPGHAALRAELEASDVVETSSPPPLASGGERPPVVLDGDRLYLLRMFEAEWAVAHRLRVTASGAEQAPKALVEAALQRLFGDDASPELCAAARAASSGRLCMITGGPGTGKTTMAAQLIALLVELGLAEPRRIAMATPTGKAAARLQESVASQMSELQATVPALAEFAPVASTVHRLLGGDRLGRLDALVVDECSMVDLRLMSDLLASLAEGTRLILLGDAEQLSSVAPGSVFSDLCGAGDAPSSALGAALVRLTTNYRFAQGSGIGRFAAAITRGDTGAALACIEDRQDPATGHAPLGEAEFDAFAEDYARTDCIPVLEAVRRGEEVAFPKRRILCAHRSGPFGVARFNRLVERHLRERNLIPDGDEFFVGRPIIVLRNHRPTGLSNGDTGVVIEGEDGQRQVWFPDLSHGERYLVSPARLPEHESFFALTVHRAQGSEYDEVGFIPGPADSRVNTRELLYTAVTRAREKVTIHGGRLAIRAAIARQTARASGLFDRLLTR